MHILNCELSLLYTSIDKERFHSPFLLLLKQNFRKKIDCAIFVPLFSPSFKPLKSFTSNILSSLLTIQFFSFFFVFFSFCECGALFKKPFYFIQCLEFFFTFYFCLSSSFVVFNVQWVGKNQGENKMKRKLKNKQPR